jgi:hypothetical protein
MQMGPQGGPWPLEPFFRPPRRIWGRPENEKKPDGRKATGRNDPKVIKLLARYPINLRQ